MKSLVQTSFVILCISASVWFISKSVHSPTQKQNIHSSLSETQAKPETTENVDSIISSKQPHAANSSTLLKNRINNLLLRQDFSAAVDLFNSQYDELSASLVREIQTLFYDATQHHLEKQRTALANELITEYLKTIQDEQAYILLARTRVKQADYRAAIDAAVSAYGLAFDSLRQQRIEQYITQIALSYYKKERRKNSNGNLPEVLQALTQLHYLFPENAQLTYETASLLREMGEIVTAQQYLSSLIYTNNDYSQAAENLLSAIAQQNQRSSQDQLNTPKTVATSNSIVIPLQRAGSSYLIDVVINRSTVTLLLDTGASITALSQPAIDRLDLDKTNRKVRLSTANGTRTSNIYHADSLQLNSVQLNKVAIVQIDLGRKARIDGLLGTDVLQQFNYQIDNSTHSLALTPR